MIEPFFKDKDVTLYYHDCIAGMHEMAEGLYELLVTSPPYNVGEKYEQGVTFGEYLKLISDFYVESFRIIRKGGYCIVNFGDYYTSYTEEGQLIPMEVMHHVIAERAGWIEKASRIWKKDFARLGDRFSINTNLPKDEHEHLVTFRKPGGGKEKVREQAFHPHSVWDTSGKHQEVTTRKFHQAAFPEYLVVMVLNVYSDPGDTVIDPFSGSGTTLYVAKKLGRKGIGFETDIESCEFSRTRLMQQAFDLDGTVYTTDEQVDLSESMIDNEMKRINPDGIPI